MKVAIFLSILLVNILGAKSLSPVKVTLFYETFCPASIEFLTKELYPVTENFEKYLELDLVPFGHATINGTGSNHTICQHGEKECYGNKIHACILSQLPAKGPKLVVSALACLMNLNYEEKSIRKCCKKSKIKVKRVERCLRTMYEELEVLYATRTENNEPPVKYVPMIMFNDIYNSTVEDEARDGKLKEVVCDLLGMDAPQSCNPIDD